MGVNRALTRSQGPWKGVKMVKLSGASNMSIREIAGMLGEINMGVEYHSRNPFSGSSEFGVIISDTNPADLIYPQGWYYESGFLRKKGHSLGEGIPFVRRSGQYW